MANKFSQGTVVSAGAVIAGVDADNPPVTDSGSSSGSESGLQYPLMGSDGPVHIEGDFSIVQDGFTSWTFEVEFTAPNDNQYRNIFTLGGTSDKKHGALTGYTTNSGDIFSMTSSSSGTTTDGYNYWLSGAAGEGWTGAPHRLTVIRDGNLGRTAIYKDGEFVGTHQAKVHPTWNSSVKWPTTHFEGADLTFFAYADDSVLMGDGTGVEIHGWNFSKTNTYADQGVTGSGGTITNLLPLTQTAPETPNPYVDPYAGDFIMASPSGRAISWNGGYDAIDMLHWISYGTYGENGTRSINTPGGASAIHHMRYDPVSKRVFALFTGGEAVLEANGFGGYSTDNSSDDFFTGYYYNNVTWASPNMGVVASRNQYEPEEIPDLNITWDGSTWSKAVPAPAFPHAGNFVDNFGGLQKNTSSLAHANGYNWASVHEWVSYGESHPSTNTDPRIAYIRQDDDGYVYALFTINNGQPLPGADGSYTGIHSYYGFGVWNASNAVFNLYSARSITEVDPVGNHFQVLAKTKVPYTLGLENFPAVWNEDVQGWVHTDWSA